MWLQKLDRRFHGYGRFTHRIQFLGYGEQAQLQAQKNWVECRNWLWGRYGPSAEQCLAREHNFNGSQPIWAWDSDKSAIYLKDEAVVEMALMEGRWQ